MLFLHEVHRVRGEREDEFEAAVRDDWLPRVAEGDDARLLWYANLAHGSGPSYHVVTVTAVRDGGAWERLARRLAEGDLHTWSEHVDGLRYDVVGKLLLALPWSPLREVDFDAVPTEPVEHENTVYMQDTMWDMNRKQGLDAYLRAAGEIYAPQMQEDREGGIIDIEAAFRSAPGAGRHPEVVLMQKVTSHRALLGLLTTDIPEQYRQPGTWMHDALAYRDQWDSSLLRTSVWSPLY